MALQPLYLHVGLPKTGTTDLQKVLWENRRKLASLGIDYPGRPRGTQFQAALDLLGSERSRHPGMWDSLVEQANNSSGTVVISHEMLAALDDAKIERVVGDFSQRELHVVLTVRDFSRIVPATWQERAKNREVEAWESFLEGVSEGPEGRHPFWRLQDAPRVIRAWGEQLPGDRIHVVTVPPVQEDPQLLLKRFASVVGFTVDDVALPERPANQSIGALEVAVLQEINKVSAHLEWDEYTRLIKNHVVRDVLAQRPGQKRVALPESARPWVEAEVARTREAVEETGCHVVGDLKELEPRGLGPRSDRETDKPDAVSAGEVESATAETLVALAEEVGELRSQLRWLGVPDSRARSALRQVGDRARTLVERLRSRRSAG